VIVAFSAPTVSTQTFPVYRKGTPSSAAFNDLMELDEELELFPPRLLVLLTESTGDGGTSSLFDASERADRKLDHDLEDIRETMAQNG
jgi:hypothetical protein